ncbi:PLP-dependent aminotransferase family protein [Bacillus sp. REN3]|uniref:MocR-like pyridoxine biosynthesis transcription factor PdxR n=1 Tax=Bacillus sp. REN3 TaxID=2802440 RepID=UPI001AEE1DC8|nr:PLP-dependent aminotransferase family protein [Bacillus sp. REN3]
MLWIPIDRSLDIPLIRQIHQHIRERILSGHLKSGDKLPSTRELSAELKVSRNIVIEAYDQLAAEGFINSRTGAGTYVASGTFLEQYRNASPFRLSGEDEKNNTAHNIIDFRSGIPALDLFPRKIWARLSSAIWNDTPPYTFGYDIPEGRMELRRALSLYLLKTRGVECHPDQIVITSGATQAMALVSKLLLSPGETVMMEDPITQDIQAIFESTGAQLYPIPVDKDGMMTSMLPLELSPRLVYVTPSHQFPLGGTLPIQRRIQLIHYSRKRNCYIIEDDYDSEFRYDGPPVSSLQGVEPARVLYIGSFSKILSPALRMGYLILPSQLIEEGRRLKWFSDLHTPSIDQLVLAYFIQEGYLEKHIAKMKKIYKSRRDILIQCLESSFSNKVEILGHSTGLHLIAEFEEMPFSEEMLGKIEQFGVKVYSVQEHAIEKGKNLNQLILGYGHLNNEEIEEGVARLKQALSIHHS